jgi:hypothetical protein
VVEPLLLVLQVFALEVELHFQLLALQAVLYQLVLVLLMEKQS